MVHARILLIFSDSGCSIMVVFAAGGREARVRFSAPRPREKKSPERWRRSVRRRPHGAPRSPFYILSRAAGNKKERKRKNFKELL